MSAPLPTSELPSASRGTHSLQDVLNDYIKEFKETDGGDGVAKFVEWLRDYANRLESANAEITGLSG